MWGCSPDTIEKLVKNNLLLCIKPAGKPLYPVDSVYSYVMKLRGDLF